MKEPLDITSVAKKLIGAVEGLRLPYALGGAIAQNYWGTIRATQDVDLLVSLPRVRFGELAEKLTASGFTMKDPEGRQAPVTVEGILSQERLNHMFAVYSGFVKAEVFLPFLPLQHLILRRAVALPLEDRQVQVTTAEDLILLKMAFHREKDLRDVRAILWNQQGKIDTEYLRDWANKMLADEHVRELNAWIAEYSGGS